MPGSDPNETTPASDAHSVNISGGENTIRGDVIGGDKIIQGDVNAATIGENARVGQVAVGTNITQIYNEAEQAYNVQGCENPYLGLAAFTYNERAKYAGREKLIQETVAKITAPASPVPLLFITGASGSGKSSFAQAGLLPALETYYEGFTVKRAVMRPAGDPIAAWQDVLWRQLRVETFEVLGQSRDDSLLRPMPSIGKTLEGLERTPPGQINIIVLDQFEEFFTQAPQAARERFFAFLADVPQFSQTRTHIIATMRADYLPELFNHSALYQIQQQGVPLRAMNAEELHAAIQQPLRASKYADTKRFVPALVERLAEDAARNAAYLPLLQVTLEEIWRKGFLKSDAYKNLTDAIKQRADQVLDYRDFDDANPDEKRTDAEQDALLNLLLDLVDVSADDDTHRDVRKQRAKTDLTRNEITRTRLVDELARARLLSVQQEGKDKNQIEVDLIHETLLTNWTRLQSAIAERRSELRHRARFEQNLDEWKTQQRSGDYLLEGIRLAEARELEAHGDVALQNEDAKAYLRASISKAEAEQQAELERERQRAEALEQAKRAAEKSAAAEKQRGRILRFAIAGVSVLALLAMLAGCFAFERSNAANLAKETAQAQASISNSQKLAALSISKHSEDLALSYLLGIEAFKEHDTFESRKNLFNLRFQEPRLKVVFSATSGGKVSFSPDGKMLASWNLTGVVLWDVTARQRAGFLGTHANYAPIAFSPDGKLVAMGSYDDVLLWDTATQKQAGELNGHKGEVTSVAFSRDGGIIASGSDDKTIILWDVVSQQPLGQPLMGQPDSVKSIAFSPNRKILAVASLDTVFLWDVATQKLVGELKGGGNVTSLAFSDRDNILASASTDATIRLWDVSSQKQLGEPLRGHTGSVNAVAFNNDGTILISGGDDKTIRLWDMVAYKQIGEPLIGHTSKISGVAFRSDSRTIASGGEGDLGSFRTDGILLWETTQQQYIGELNGPTGATSTFSPDGKYLVSANSDTVLLWDVDQQKLSNEFKGRTNSVAFSPDGKIIASGGYRKISLWDPATGKIKSELNGHKDDVTHIAFSPDGKTLASASEDHSIMLWDMMTQKSLGELNGHSSPVSSIAFSPDGKTLASGSWEDGSTRLWDVATRKPITAFSGGRQVVFSPDGKILASADSWINLWDINTKQSKGELNSRNGTLSLAFSPDGKILVSGGGENTIQLWDTTTKQLIGEFKGHKGEIRNIAFSPNEKRLVSWSSDSKILLWDIDVWSWLDSICNVVHRNLTREEYAQYINSDPTAYDSKYANNRTCQAYEIEPAPTPTPIITPTPMPTRPLAEIAAGEAERNFRKAAGAIHSGDSQTASEIFAVTVEWALLADDANLNNKICWYGSVDGFSKIVLPTCEHAVTLEPNNAENRDSRGLARALSGDTQGAIADFKTFVETYQNSTDDQIRKWVDQRKKWIATLENGGNPFDAETMRSLHDE